MVSSGSATTSILLFVACATTRTQRPITSALTKMPAGRPKRSLTYCAASVTSGQASGTVKLRCDIRPGERTDETHDRENERRTAAWVMPDRTVRFQGDGRAGQKEGNRKHGNGRGIRPRREAPERDVLDADIAVAREPD